MILLQNMCQIKQVLGTTSPIKLQKLIFETKASDIFKQSTEVKWQFFITVMVFTKATVSMMSWIVSVLYFSLNALQYETRCM